MDDDIFMEFLKEAMQDFAPSDFYIDTAAAAPNFITGEGYLTLAELREELEFTGSDVELLQEAGSLIATKILLQNK
jgi:hypothetical protein